MDTSAVAVSKRFREELLRHDIPSDTEAARRAGVNQQWLSRRLTGDTEWSLSDLDRVCTALGISYVYVATGVDDQARTAIPVESIMRLIADQLGHDGERDHVGDQLRSIGDPPSDHGLKSPDKQA